MRHLITGGAGFIGSMAARRLREAGAEVRVLDLNDDPARRPDIEFVDCSVLDRDRVAAAMAGVDVVHHMAALVAQTDAGRRYRQVNVEGTRIVAEEAVKAKVKAIVHLSTTAVYGIPPKGPITARTPLRPVEPYGRSKLAAEEIIDEICRRDGVPLITIRPRATLGAGRLGVYQVLFEWIADGRTVYVIGNGLNRFQMVHAHDLMDFYMLALEAGKTGTYNVGTNGFGTLRGDLEALIGHAGSPSRVKSLPAGMAINGLRALHYLRLSPVVPWHYLTSHMDCYFDVEPLLAMGWRPKYTNAGMLSESFDWYRARQLAAQSAPLPGSAAASPHRSPLAQGALRLAKWVS